MKPRAPSLISSNYKRLWQRQKGQDTYKTETEKQQANINGIQKV